MDAFLSLVESDDWISLIVLIGLSCWFGGVMVDSRPKLKQVGQRLAAFAVIGYCILVATEQNTTDAGVWLGIVFRGLIAGGLVLGPSWICLSICGWIKDGVSSAFSASGTRATSRRFERKRRAREAEEERKRLEWESGASEREKQRRLAEEEANTQKSLRATAQRTRDDIRYSCELFFNQHASTIESRFTRADMQSFFDRYMDDSQPPEVVQRRANQLSETIREHIDAENPPEKMLTFEELATWYAEQKGQIEKMGVSDLEKQEYKVQLQERYTELTQKLMESIKP